MCMYMEHMYVYISLYMHQYKYGKWKIRSIGLLLIAKELGGYLVGNFISYEEKD